MLSAKLFNKDGNEIISFNISQFSEVFLDKKYSVFFLSPEAISTFDDCKSADVDTIKVYDKGILAYQSEKEYTKVVEISDRLSPLGILETFIKIE